MSQTYNTIKLPHTIRFVKEYLVQNCYTEQKIYIKAFICHLTPGTTGGFAVKKKALYSHIFRFFCVLTKKGQSFSDFFEFFPFIC
jgi:hypothetical protein